MGCMATQYPQALSLPRHPHRKKYGAGNARLLDRHGTMLGGLSYQVGKRSVTVGFADPYAVFHEFGTKRMARRSMLTTNPERGFNPRPPLLTGESGAARQIR